MTWKSVLFDVGRLTSLVFDLFGVWPLWCLTLLVFDLFGVWTLTSRLFSVIKANLAFVSCSVLKANCLFIFLSVFVDISWWIVILIIAKAILNRLQQYFHSSIFCLFSISFFLSLLRAALFCHSIFLCSSFSVPGSFFSFSFLIFLFFPFFHSLRLCSICRASSLDRLPKLGCRFSAQFIVLISSSSSGETS